MMNTQEIIVLLIFAVSVFFVGRRIYKSIVAKECGNKCGGCSSIDFSKIDTTKINSK